MLKETESLKKKKNFTIQKKKKILQFVSQCNHKLRKFLEKINKQHQVKAEDYCPKRILPMLK